MKKVLFVFCLVCVIIGTAFAQQQRPANPSPTTPAKPATSTASTEAKNALGIDLFQMTKGFIATDSDSSFFAFIVSASYERLVAPHVSIGGDVDTYFMDFSGTPAFYFSLAGEGRYYTMSTNFEKFFLGTTLGFNLLSMDGRTGAQYGGFFGLITSLKAGYKLILGKMYLEPSMSYVLSKSSALGGLAMLFGGASIPTPLGWNGGLRFGFVF